MASPARPSLVDQLLHGFDGVLPLSRHRSEGLSSPRPPQPSGSRGAVLLAAAGVSFAASDPGQPSPFEALFTDHSRPDVQAGANVAATAAIRGDQPAPQAAVAAPSVRPEPGGLAAVASAAAAVVAQPGAGSLQGDRDADLDDDCHLREATLVAGADQTSTVALMDLSWTFQLHSSPTSSKVIYLDFDGHTTSGTSWNNATMGASFYSPAYDLDGNPGSFNSEELSRIQQIWQRVAADYAPFDVDVTTQAPPTDWLIRSGSTDANFGIRAVITSYGPSSATAGGIAVVNSFTASTDTPCFIYNKSLTGVAEAISHEVGHTLGLSHDGTSSSAYYYGHGSGETSWAPIMGVGYNKNVTQWDNGTYYGSNNKSSTANYGRGPDDMKVISTYNGFGYQSDQVGNSFANASPLTISSGVVGQFGRIETAADVDCYSFLLQSNGNVNLSFDPYWYRAYVDRDGAWGGNSLIYTAPVSDANGGTAYADSGTNLDLAVGLYNSVGTLLGSFDGAGLATTLAWSNLEAGSYYLRLDGVGTGNPTSSTPSGYTDYDSVGNYWISGTITGAADSTALITATSSPSTATSSPSTGGSAAGATTAGGGKAPAPQAGNPAPQAEGPGPQAAAIAAESAAADPLTGIVAAAPPLAAAAPDILLDAGGLSIPPALGPAIGSPRAALEPPAIGLLAPLPPLLGSPLPWGLASAEGIGGAVAAAGLAIPIGLQEPQRPLWSQA